MNYEELLAELGIDAQKTLERFGGMRAIHEKFLMKFPEDPTYGMMELGIEEQDLEKTERGVHTLKGLSANLGMEKLYHLCEEGVRYVREEQEVLPAGLLEKITEEYKRIVDRIKAYQEEK